MARRTVDARVCAVSPLPFCAPRHGIPFSQPDGETTSNSGRSNGSQRLSRDLSHEDYCLDTQPAVSRRVAPLLLSSGQVLTRNLPLEPSSRAGVTTTTTTTTITYTDNRDTTAATRLPWPNWTLPRSTHPSVREPHSQIDPALPARNAHIPPRPPVVSRRVSETRYILPSHHLGRTPLTYRHVQTRVAPPSYPMVDHSSGCKSHPPALTTPWSKGPTSPSWSEDDTARRALPATKISP